MMVDCSLISIRLKFTEFGSFYDSG
ncbi:hypothetical protein LMED105_14023 [Limnobacter sp. MED105]|nr:hypothetical protein LMED105_14023 [Limnobacter sp. MED105]